MPSYSRGPLPFSNENTQYLSLYVATELDRIQSEINLFKCASFFENTVLPARYKTGDLYLFAEGVAGTFRGFYWYDGAVWRFLGESPAVFGGIFRDTDVIANVTAGFDKQLINYTTADPDFSELLQNEVNGNLVVVRKGVYTIDAQATLLNPSPNNTWSIVLTRNAVPLVATRSPLFVKDNGAGFLLHTFMTMPLLETDVIAAAIRCDNSNNVIVTSMKLTAVRHG